MENALYPLLAVVLLAAIGLIPVALVMADRPKRAAKRPKPSVRHGCRTIGTNHRFLYPSTSGHGKTSFTRDWWDQKPDGGEFSNGDYICADELSDMFDE